MIYGSVDSSALLYSEKTFRKNKQRIHTQKRARNFLKNALRKMLKKFREAIVVNGLLETVRSNTLIEKENQEKEKERKSRLLTTF